MTHQERGGATVDVERLRDGMGEIDARGLTPVEREFVGGRLITGSIDAQQGLPGGLWSIRYCQDVPKLLREVVALRAQLAERDAQIAEWTEVVTHAISWQTRAARAEQAAEEMREVVDAATRVDVCLYAFQGNEMHLEQDGCLTRLHEAIDQTQQQAARATRRESSPRSCSTRVMIAPAGSDTVGR